MGFERYSMYHTWDMGIINMFTSMDLNTGLVALNSGGSALAAETEKKCENKFRKTPHLF